MNAINELRARVGQQRYLDTAEVIGSSPIGPTIPLDRSGVFSTTSDLPDEPEVHQNDQNSGEIGTRRDHETAIVIPLSGGYHALIDLADFERVSPYKWSHHTNGWQHYGVRQVKGVRIYLHRFIMDAQPGQLVDHINGNGLDCQRSNMRFATHAGNRQNQRAYNPTGFKGVRLASTGKYEAKIKVGGHLIHLGRFPTPEEAAVAYDLHAQHHFGEFARLNFPVGAAGANRSEGFAQKGDK